MKQFESVREVQPGWLGGRSLRRCETGGFVLTSVTLSRGQCLPAQRRSGI
jgi:hypothetical protein